MKDTALRLAESDLRKAYSEWILECRALQKAEGGIRDYKPANAAYRKFREMAFAWREKVTQITGGLIIASSELAAPSPSLRKKPSPSMKH